MPHTIYRQVDFIKAGMQEALKKKVRYQYISKRLFIHLFYTVLNARCVIWLFWLKHLHGKEFWRLLFLVTL